VVTISRSKTHQNTEGEGTYAENNFKKLCFDKTSDEASQQWTTTKWSRFKILQAKEVTKIL
jgi:hypothetical protein